MIYEYRCDTCKVKWQEWRSVSKRNDPTPCPSCNQNGKRNITPVKSIFKTEGFPSNDFRSGAFYRPDGRSMSFEEYEFLQKEAADDAAAKPETVTEVAKRGDTGKLLAGEL